VRITGTGFPYICKTQQHQRTEEKYQGYGVKYGNQKTYENGTETQTSGY